jgi:osmotically-inducible protein OsmY
MSARQPYDRFRLLSLLATVAAAGSCLAQDAAGKADAKLREVVIQAQRQTADAEITRQLQTTLTEDRWIFAEHVTVTTRNGVVRIEGIVQDTGELFRILRLARKIPGTRRVVDAMEILHNDPDGG